MSDKAFMLASYFIDTSLLDCTLMKEKPSKVAAMAVYAAQRVTKGTSSGNGGVWNATLTKNTGYKEDEIKLLAAELVEFVKNVEKSSLKTMSKKYSRSKYLEVA